MPASSPSSKNGTVRRALTSSQRSISSSEISMSSGRPSSIVSSQRTRRAVSASTHEVSTFVYALLRRPEPGASG